MALKLIEPLAIEITGALPTERFFTQTFYLGYGRNAWHSTWINRYSPNSVSFDVDELKRHAEGQRVQGSVFRIQSLPMMVLRYKQNSFGIMPINDRSKYEYNDLSQRIEADEPCKFWHQFPSSKSNWLLIFILSDEALNRREFVSLQMKSESFGANHKLGWTEAKIPADTERFFEFASALGNLLGKVEHTLET